MGNLAILVLAAGQARRMGRAKQLLPFQGKPLFLHSLDKAGHLGAGYLHLVLGAHRAEIAPLVPAEIAWSENPDWETGMSSSIRCGIEAIERDYPQADAVLILLADQPFIRIDQLQEMVRQFDELQPPILVAAYADRIGVPALFERSLFPIL
ncbi:MAG: nucleotidyltransferase family protein, partial [Phaeodactylibacter sp.]|nr:nucleotidyltransferase family protein [Phaeodactylibacter sp.]